MKRSTLVLAALLAVTGAGSAFPLAAQQTPAPPPPQETPEALLRSGIENLLRALGLALQNLPQYEMPQVNEYGDIVIRRVNPLKPRPVPPAEEGTRRL